VLLKVKKVFCIFRDYAESRKASKEIARKESELIWRICRKYLSVPEEYGNLELFAKYTKSSPNIRKVFKCIRRIRGKNLHSTCMHTWSGRKETLGVFS
jgi:hypothetical protein